MKFSRLAAVAFLTFTVISTARAQLPALDPLADRMAASIVKSKRKSVIVLDFAGPGEKYTALGQAFADKFSEALSKSSDKFSVAARAQIGEGLAKNDVPPSSFHDPLIALWVAGESHIQAVITGKIMLSGNELGISVECHRTDSGKEVANLKTTSTISAEMRDLMNEVVEYPDPKIDSSVRASGEAGYSYPACAYCPQASYDQRAVGHSYQGTVLLSAIVGAGGRESNIVVLKALRYGLTAKATEAVSSWKFRPALDPHGTPAPVRQTIEVAFHLY
jgi:TonB family protein